MAVEKEVAFSELVDAFKLEADTKDDETPILMRSLQLSDAPKLNELVNKNIAHLSPWMPWAKKPNSAEETEAFVRMTMNDLVARRAVQYGIFVGNEIVGCIGNHPVQVCENYTKTSIGYWLGKDHNGKGVMTRCVTAFIESPILWHVLKVDRVEISCDERNSASRAIPERLGLRNIGKHARKECCDCIPVVYEMLRPSFSTLSGAPFLSQLSVDKPSGIELRVVDVSHCEALVKLINENRKDLTWIDESQDISLDYVRETIERSLGLLEEKTSVQWSIFVGNELVGRCGIQRVDKVERRADIGYWLDRSHRGKGVITKCVRAIVASPVPWLILGLNTVEIWCDAANERACAVPRRIGFNELGKQTRANAEHNPIGAVFEYDRPLLYR